MSTWTAIGPAPILNGQTAGGLAVSGSVTGIAPDATDPNTIYIATACGGVWKTTDGGSSWNPLTDNLTDASGHPLPMLMASIAEIRVAGGSQIIYAGTLADSSDAHNDSGILVSTDSGATWTVRDPSGFTGITVPSIAIDRSDPTGQTVYAAINPLGQDGIWKSTDGGVDWTNTTLNAGISGFDYWHDVVIDPNNDGILFANESGMAGVGVYKSTDGGNTWNPLGGLSTQGGNSALAISDNGVTTELFVSIANVTTGGLLQLAKSTDLGATFTDLTANALTTSDYMGTQGNLDQTLAIDPLNSNYIYAAGSFNKNGPTFSGSPVESFDGGRTWKDIGTDSAGNGPYNGAHAVAFDTAGNLFDGDDGGIFRLDTPTDSVNQKWASLNSNLDTIQLNSIAVDPNNPRIAYGGSQGNGIEKYTGQLGWNRTQPGDGGVTRVDPTNSNYVYTENGGLNLQFSADGGITFKDISPGIAFNNNLGGGPIIYRTGAPYVVDSTGAIYVGTDFLNVSTDHGTTWTKIGSPGVNGFNPFDSEIVRIAVDPNNNNIVGVLRMFVTQNAHAQPASSVHWDLIFTTTDFSSSLAVLPTNGAIAYYSDTVNVFMTDNFGGTWNNITGNLLPATVHSIQSIALSADGSTIYIGTYVGVYTSTFTGNVWTRFGTGLPNAQVVDLEVLPGLNLLAAGTEGRGVFEIALNGNTNQAPAIYSADNTSFVIGQPGSFFVAATGASPPLTLTENGTLPAGVTFVDNGGGNATLSGAPNAGTAGTYTFTITASNGMAPNATQNFMLTVEGLAITTATLPTFVTQGQAGYLATIGTVGGIAPITFAVTLGTLPVGLLLDPNTGTITGTPTTVTGLPTDFTVTATDANSAHATHDYTIVVIPREYSYDSFTRTLIVTTSNFNYSQGTDAILGHTFYNFSADQDEYSFPDTRVTRVIVNPAGSFNIANLITNDTYEVSIGVIGETVEAVTVGNGGGMIQKLDANGVARDFLTVTHGFQGCFAVTGAADQGFMECTPGVKNVYVAVGAYSYMNTGNNGEDFYYLSGAKFVYCNALTGTDNALDFAYLYDGTVTTAYQFSGTAYSLEIGSDKPYFSPNTAVSFQNYAIGFQFNEGETLNNPGADIAYFYDSAGNDLFQGFNLLTSESSGDHTFAESNVLAQNPFVLARCQVYAFSFVGGIDQFVNDDRIVNHFFNRGAVV